MTTEQQLQLEALKMIQEFSMWMMIVEAGLLATYSRWITTDVIRPSSLIKFTTLIGFGGALFFASLRIGFLSDIAQRLGSKDFISDMSISHVGLLENIPLSYLGVPQHILFFLGLLGFALSAWSLKSGD